MAEFLKQPDLVNEKYIIDRIGYVGKNIRNNFSGKKDSKQGISNLMKIVKKIGIKKVSKYIIKK